MSSCVFCRIAAMEAPARIVYQDDAHVAFEDINPQAPVHIVVIPRRHIETVLDADADALGKLLFAACRVAESAGLDKNGFRTVINCRRHGGQSVYHLHVHILGGRWLGWPPG